MSALPEQQRAFVLRLMELGPTKKAAAKAAGDVGLAPNYGYELMRDDRVLAAIREEATKELAGGVLIGVKRLIDIARDADHKDSFKAAKELAGMNGFTTEQKITVEHISNDSKELIRQIQSMSNELNVDLRPLIEKFGIVDAEFTEVSDG